MAGDAASALSLLTVQADCDHALRLDLERNLIAEDDLATRNSEASLSAYCDRCQRRRLNTTDARSAGGRKADGCCRDGKAGAPERVRDGNLEFGSFSTPPELYDEVSAGSKVRRCLNTHVWRGRHVARFDELGHARPRVDPVVSILSLVERFDSTTVGGWG
jgi:hypothetical protein